MGKERIIVITEGGFLTSKKPNEVLATDIRQGTGTEDECNRMIHGEQKKEKI